VTDLVHLPPAPKGFTSATQVSWARLAQAPHFAHRPHRRTGRRLAGVKYENQVQEMLLAAHGASYLPSPWLQFSTPQGLKWCQPDGLLFDLDHGAITIVEVKYQHTTDAWWQLRRLYEPVLQKIFPSHLWQFHTLELVKWYDQAILWPEPLRLVANPTEAKSLPFNTTGVHIWKP